MNWIQVLIMSGVEGVSEYLPVSSTGHMILAARLLGVAQSGFVKTFEIAIQLGAILAVVVLFWDKFWRNWKVLKRVIWVFVPTAGLGFVFYRLIKQWLVGNLRVTVVSLVVGGIVMIVLEQYFLRSKPGGKIEKLSLKQALVLGVIQAISVVPGVSRAAATIFGGMALGLSRSEATELSFLVAVPVMAVATGYDLLKNIKDFRGNQFELLLLGMVGAFVTAMITVKWLTDYVKNHDFRGFGVYRIVVGVIFGVMGR